MNEDFNSIIDQYRADGRDDGYIARKIFLSGDYSGDFDDLVNMVSSYKKKRPSRTGAYSGSASRTDSYRYYGFHVGRHSFGIYTSRQDS